MIQPVLAAFIDEGHFATHVRRMRRLYATRQAALVAAAGRHLGDFLTVAPDDAGLHLMAWLTPEVARRLGDRGAAEVARSEEHTSELQSLMRISYAVFCLKKKKH